MATGIGYVKVYRSLIDHWAFADDAVLYLWLNLLLRANWKEGKFWPGGSTAPIIVGRGQLVTGRNALHAMLYPATDSMGRTIKRDRPPPHPTTIWRWLLAMEKDGMVSLDVRNSCTVVTMCNYDSYQQSGDDECATGVSPVRKSRARRAQPTHSTRASDAQVTHTIEEEQEKKEGEESKKQTATLPELLQTPEFESAWADWLKHRAEIKKPLKPTQAVAQLRVLSAWGVDRAIAAIRHTIFKGWQGIREPDAPAPNGHPPPGPLWTPKAPPRSTPA